MKLVLSGGGKQETRLLADFASLVVKGGRVLNLPWARPDPADPNLHEWVANTLWSVGLRDVTTATTVGPEVAERLDSFDAVFIGGGNTYRLLARLREAGVETALTEFVQSGRPCYGGSAGAIVLGSSIATCAHLDKNEDGLVDLAGLNLCHGRALWAHAVEDDHQRISAFVAATSSEVLAVPENTAVYVEANKIASLGEGQVWSWNIAGRIRVPPWNELSPNKALQADT